MGEMGEMRKMLLLGLHGKVFDRLGIKTKALVGSKNGFPPLCGIPSTLMQQALLIEYFPLHKKRLYLQETMAEVC